jgi:hypothetical protein
MASTRSFSAMLNDYLPNDLLKEEIIKRDWLLSNIERDDGWQGASSTSGEAAYIVPFVGGNASSIEFGQLASSTDVAEDTFVRGRINSQKEAWGTMVFNHRDLMEHGKGLNEKSFLKILPDRVETFMQTMKEAVSVQLLNGANFATDYGSGSTMGSGLLKVDRIDRFSIGQKFTLDDGTHSKSLYVTAIDINTQIVTVSATRGGSAYTGLVSTDLFTANSTSNKFYHPGAKTAPFQSLVDALLSSANGGGSTLYGVTKTAYPYTQAVNVDGSTINAANILDKLFDAYAQVRIKAKGNASTILMSFKHLASVMKAIEVQKGGFKVAAGDTKASEYGWTEISITSVKGELKIVGIQEMPDAQIVFLDPKALVFASNGFFRKRESPNGNEYFEVRNTTGYQYLVDICLFGDLVVKAPGHCGILYSISY